MTRDVDVREGLHLTTQHDLQPASGLVNNTVSSGIEPRPFCCFLLLNTLTAGAYRARQP